METAVIVEWIKKPKTPTTFCDFNEYGGSAPLVPVSRVALFSNCVDGGLKSKVEHHAMTLSNYADGDAAAALSTDCQEGNSSGNVLGVYALNPRFRMTRNGGKAACVVECDKVF